MCVCVRVVSLSTEWARIQVVGQSIKIATDKITAAAMKTRQRWMGEAAMQLCLRRIHHDFPWNKSCRCFCINFARFSSQVSNIFNLKESNQRHRFILVGEYVLFCSFFFLCQFNLVSLRSVSTWRNFYFLSTSLLRLIHFGAFQTTAAASNEKETFRFSVNMQMSHVWSEGHACISWCNRLEHVPCVLCQRKHLESVALAGRVAVHV